MQPSELTAYKFSIYNNAMLVKNEDTEDDTDHDTEDDDSETDDLDLELDVNFYCKQTFVVYLRKSTRTRIGNDMKTIYELAYAALYQADTDVLSDGEYLEDDYDDKFVCFANNVERDAQKYLKENNINNYECSSDGGSTAFGQWELSENVRNSV
jgi:hypothetical protein